MSRRAAGLLSLLVLAWVLLAPVAVVADPCPDCGPAQGCCLASGCFCCVAVASILTAPLRAMPALARMEVLAGSGEGRRLAAHVSGVFHVPRSPLA